MSLHPMLDPDVERYIQRKGVQTTLKHDATGINALRMQYRKRDDSETLPPIELAQILDDTIAGRAGAIAIRRYIPLDCGHGPQPTILFFHGGGWVSGDLDSHDDICRHMAHLSGVQVIAVNYRLAPENPFPAAVEDAIDSYAMLLAHASRWNVDTHRIAVMGDETGGTLASVVAIHARDMCQPIPSCQILFYPATDLANESASFRRQGVKLARSPQLLRWLHSLYLGDQADPQEWRASPLHTRSFAGLPPSFVTVGDQDHLHDEVLEYSNRLYKAGVTVRLHILPGQINGYLSLGGLMAEASRSLEEAAGFLKKCLTEQKRSVRRIRPVTV